VSWEELLSSRRRNDVGRLHHDGKKTAPAGVKKEREAQVTGTQEERKEGD